MFTSTTMQDALTVTPLIERLGRDFRATSIVYKNHEGQPQRTTYGAVAGRALRLAEALVGAGLRAGDRVATLMSNHAIHLEALLGIPASGGVFHALNPRLSQNDLAYVMRDAQDRMLLVDAAQLDVLARVRDQIQLEKVIVVGSERDEYEAFIARSSASFVPPEIDERAPFGVSYTSGTTGRPKGLVHSHRATILHSLGAGMVDGFGLSRADNILTVAPFFHAHAIGFPYASALLGAAQVLLDVPMPPEQLLDWIAREQVTVTGGLATSWAAMLTMLERFPGRWKLSPRFRVIAGGNALPAALVRRFESLEIDISHTWGMTETGPLSTMSRRPANPSLATSDVAAHIARQGSAAPLIRIRITDESGAEQPWDDRTVGEVQVRGPWVTGSYLRGAESLDRDTTSSFTKDGWLRTGDLGVMDAQGSLRIVDRLKDVIRVGEEWVSSTAMEDCLNHHPAVAETAIVSAPDLEHGELPLAIVVCKPGASVTADELRAMIPVDVLAADVPMPVVWVNELPRAPTGKLDKKGLRARYGRTDISS
jgi:fatty-acyl-CoA synthase